MAGQQCQIFPDLFCKNNLKTARTHCRVELVYFYEQSPDEEVAEGKIEENPQSTVRDRERQLMGKECKH